MTRRHYDSPKLRRYAQRKLIRHSWRYRLARWARRASRRMDTFSGFVRMWALLTLGAFFVVVWLAGPGSGLLPSPWDVIVGWIVGVIVVVWTAWSKSVRENKKKPARERQSQ
ncbi:MAG: hypothetical protein ABW171_00790 [Steroidobacter sp.]